MSISMERGVAEGGIMKLLCERVAVGRRMITLVMAGCIASVSLPSVCGDLSFDSPFVASPYKKALDCCMRLWADVQDVSEVEVADMQQEACSFAVYAIVGRLFCLKIGMERLDLFSVHREDVAYLVRLIKLVESDCDLLPKNDEQAQSIQKLFAAIWVNLQ